MISSRRLLPSLVGTASRIPVHLGENHTGDPDRLVEALRDATLEQAAYLSVGTTEKVNDRDGFTMGVKR